MYFRYFLSLLLFSLPVAVTATQAQDSNQAVPWCADFEGQAGNTLTSPINLAGFAFEWNAAEAGHVIESSAIGGDYLRAYSEVKVGLPLPSNSVTVRVLSEGESTTHDFILKAFDAAGAELASQTVVVAAASVLDVELAGPRIASVTVGAVDGPMNEAGIQRICVPVLAAP